MSSRPHYGIDSPAIVAGLFVLSGLGFSAALMWRLFGDPPVVAEIVLLGVGAYFLLGGVGMVSYSKHGKLRIRDEILEAIRWRGDEKVLDVGCGRGLLVIGVACRLTTGMAVGLDRWVAGALTGNCAEAVLDNARLEGVLDRLAVMEGDVRQLPFSDDSFDVVVSNFVVHEVNNRAEREQMLREIVRVLKPGGRLALVDFIFTAECVRVLQAIGIADAERSRVGSFFSYWLRAVLNFGFVQTYLVTGSKPSTTAAGNAQAAHGGSLAEPSPAADGGRDAGSS